MENKAPRRLRAAQQLLLSALAITVIATPILTGSSGATSTGKPEGLSGLQLVQQRLTEQRQPRKVIAFAPAQFDTLVGYYRMISGDVFSVSRHGDRYLVGVIGQRPDQVYPESSHKFFLKGFDPPAQYSFKGDAVGAVTEMILHQSGEEQHAARITEAEGKAAEVALAQRIAANAPSAGTREAVARQIAGLMSGHPDYRLMAGNLAAGTRQMLPILHTKLAHWGAVTSISFAGVGKNGMDIFDVRCRNQRSRWWIAPLSPEGKTSGIYFEERG